MKNKLINIKKEKNISYIYIGRGTPFGNPYSIQNGGMNRDEVINAYKYDFDKRIETDLVFKLQVLLLNEKTLGCSCKPLACHGDIFVNYLDNIHDIKAEIDSTIIQLKSERPNVNLEDVYAFKKQIRDNIMNNEFKFWKGDMITSMTGNNIFVYGANPEFRNGAGAAKAARKFGAKAYGGGRGIVGNTFGLITKNLKAGYVEQSTGIVYEKSGYRSVSPEQIRDNIEELYDCARENPHLKFFITYKNEGKNLNGYSHKEMWDMFTVNKNVPENIRFHESYKSLAYFSVKDQKVERMAQFKQGYNQAVKQGSVSTTVVENGEKKDKFNFFWLTYSPFSQWHPALFQVKNTVFTSAEQFMMYCKAKLFKDEEIAQQILDLNMKNPVLSKFIDAHFQEDGYFRNQILKDKELIKEWNNTQKEIKALGRKVRNYNEEEWCKHRENYVYRGNLEKFNQNEDLKEILLNTGDSIMVEASPYDKIWGIGMKKEHPDATNPEKWQGLNLLGNILTKLKINLGLEQQHDYKNNFDNVVLNLGKPKK